MRNVLRVIHHNTAVRLVSPTYVYRASFHPPGLPSSSWERKKHKPYRCRRGLSVRHPCDRAGVAPEIPLRTAGERQANYYRLTAHGGGTRTSPPAASHQPWSLRNRPCRCRSAARPRVYLLYRNTTASATASASLRKRHNLEYRRAHTRKRSRTRNCKRTRVRHVRRTTYRGTCRPR